MALVVEDGTGRSDAQSYIDVTYLDGYALLRGEDLTQYTDAQKEAAIYICANDFMDALHTFAGTVINNDQGLSLPTDEVDLTDIRVSRDIKDSNANGAILQLKGALLVDTTAEDIAGDVQSLTSKVDVITDSVTYFKGTNRETKYSTPIIDRLLAPYLSGGGGVSLIPS